MQIYLPGIHTPDLCHDYVLNRPQRGLLVGVSHRRVDFTIYIFNAGWTDPTVVLALGFKF